MHQIYELTSYSFRAIVSHLVDLEENRDEIINGLFSEPSTLRDNFTCFLDNYLKKLDELITEVQIVDNPSREKLKSLNYLPYVIIGSTVDLEDVNNLNNHFVKLVLPYDTFNSKNDLSCLSALGKSLMLKKPGDIIKTKANEDECLYKIKSVRYN